MRNSKESNRAGASPSGSDFHGQTPKTINTGLVPPLRWHDHRGTAAPIYLEPEIHITEKGHQESGEWGITRELLFWVSIIALYTAIGFAFGYYAGGR